LELKHAGVDLLKVVDLGIGQKGAKADAVAGKENSKKDEKLNFMVKY
jgi:hypothetical protein